MALRGILFDFNGTLFLDSELHIRAFDIFTQKYFNRRMSAEEFEAHIVGGTMINVMEYLFQRKMTEEEADYYGEEKEKLYRSFITADMKLVDGAEKLFDELSVKGIPFAIDSAAPKSNVDFYRDFFGLNKWFDEKRFVYKTPDIAGKPEPDIYFRAAEAINTTPDKCLVFEDSPTGLMAAHRANAAYVVAIASNMNKTFEPPVPNLVISNFNDFDRELLKQI